MDGTRPRFTADATLRGLRLLWLKSTSLFSGDSQTSIGEVRLTWLKKTRIRTCLHYRFISGNMCSHKFYVQPTYLSTTIHLPTVISRYSGLLRDRHFVSVIERVHSSGVR